MLFSQIRFGLPTLEQWGLFHEPVRSWIAVLLLGSLIGCSSTPDPMEESAPAESHFLPGSIEQVGEQVGSENLGHERVEVYQGEDGTQFVADPEGCGALTSSFPGYLLMPGSQVLSSGVIGDEEGSLMSVRILTSADAEAVAKHYRDDLWYRRWDLLSESDQEGFLVWVLEDTHPDPTRYGRQVMIQVSPARETQREILVMLSQMQPQNQLSDQRLVGTAQC
ncbi:MAG: hypothetical protein HC924_02685 [Synechococcaceae cyanobacterium SM2_3_2]|nr:hypothetical protein [Synechococcaceae cyanobacterium SM2_3_2]